MNTPSIKSTTLHFREGSSDKVYQAAVEPKDDGYIVTFAYGRRGNLKKKCPEVMQSQITSVCRCLATLPPCIPKEVLASAAKLESSDIDSFVADLGRPLWISDNLVYFRDEPTESWFRDTFAAETGQISDMVEDLMPLSETSTYVARALPSLLHRAKKSDELLALALSDRGLPRNAGAAEVKEITIQRTQFAFKAALRGNRLLDATKLAFKAAEEMAGTERVDELLQRNADFIGSCLSPAATQELALSRRLSVGWTGSSNIRLQTRSTSTANIIHFFTRQRACWKPLQ